MILTVGYQTSCMMNLTLFLYLAGQAAVMLTILEKSFALSAITWKYNFRLKKRNSSHSLRVGQLSPGEDGG